MGEQTISRSPGLPITIGGQPTPWIAGGGFRGASSELDECVQRAAELLAEAYSLPVVIRFNSDRRSGGAWLNTHETDGFGANAEIGICARLWSGEMQERAVARHQREIDTLNQEIADMQASASGDQGRVKLLRSIADTEQRMLEHAQATEPGIYVQAHIGAAALTDKTLATSYQDDPDRAYYHGEQDSLEDALAFVLGHGSLEHLDLSWIGKD